MSMGGRPADVVLFCCTTETMRQSTEGQSIEYARPGVRHALSIRIFRVSGARHECVD